MIFVYSKRNNEEMKKRKQNIIQIQVLIQNKNHQLHNNVKQRPNINNKFKNIIPTTTVPKPPINLVPKPPIKPAPKPPIKPAPKPPIEPAPKPPIEPAPKPLIQPAPKPPAKKYLFKTICNVYQEIYKENKKATGFGDFIRGCYFIMEFCECFNLKYDINFNHPLSSFLKNKNTNISLNENILKNISLFEKTNSHSSTIDSNGNIQINTSYEIINEFDDYIKQNNSIQNDIMYVYTIAFPNNYISNKNRCYMRHILEPTDEINENIDLILNNLNLKKNEYSVIHIRCGDNYLNENDRKFTNDYVTKLSNKIISNIKVSNKYLLITDNNPIKKILVNKFPFIKTFLKDITHFGEGIRQEIYKIKNTMLDFYLLSYSNNIDSYSVYGHGSGFSKWCAVTYNIPYTCKMID